MPIEIRNQSLGLVEAFKKEPAPVVLAAGKGAEPPRTKTAIGMGEPEENRSPIPFAVWDAFEGTQDLKWRNDDPYDLIMDRKLFWALHQIDPQDLPGLDEILQKYDSFLTQPTPPYSEAGKNQFLLRCYKEGLIKPQNWIQRLTLPIKFALMRY
jgi:hypothetical protein